MSEPIIPPFVIGQKVVDTLTGKLCTVIGIQYRDGICLSNFPCVKALASWAIFIDDAYLGGTRHPWELTDEEKK